MNIKKIKELKELIINIKRKRKIKIKMLIKLM
jgi:hypothetical protein